jgi:hypothetical protein
MRTVRTMTTKQIGKFTHWRSRSERRRRPGWRVDHQERLLNGEPDYSAGLGTASAWFGPPTGDDLSNHLELLSASGSGPRHIREADRVAEDEVAARDLPDVWSIKLGNVGPFTSVAIRSTGSGSDRRTVAAVRRRGLSELRQHGPGQPRGCWDPPGVKWLTARTSAPGSRWSTSCRHR